jgi:hypothetical protein
MTQYIKLSDQEKTLSIKEIIIKHYGVNNHVISVSRFRDRDVLIVDVVIPEEWGKLWDNVSNDISMSDLVEL